ncbi:MAG: hypothetical protein JNN04_12290 [Cyclobacteriaceae bacterium]|nr:hypothetical protein [Cyclobacteriaceae bacterium]
MEEIEVNGHTIYKSDTTPENKYRPELSVLLKQTFGDGPYQDHDKVREAVTFSYNYYCDKFLGVCHSETSIRFYQLVLSQHEQTIPIALFLAPGKYPEGLTKEYVAQYRRILKWILEQGCDVKLTNNERTDHTFLARAKAVLNELVFLGEMILTCANLYAEQDMIEDVCEVLFDAKGLYLMKHKHHYDHVIEKIQASYGGLSVKHVVDKDPVDDLKTAMEKCFGIKYEHLVSVIYAIHEHNSSKGGQYVGFEFESLPMSVKSMFGQDPDQARILFNGLTLSSENKLRLHDAACRPQTMFRYMYRPITIWNIDGKDYAVIGKNALTECVIQLTTNCIPWGKAPLEWLKNACFKEYVHSKEDAHDQWLDDEVERRIAKEGLRYYRHLTSITSPTGDISLNQPNVGEIDFLIINHVEKTIYVTDCKHLQGRYDMMSQRSDYDNFTKPTGYNRQVKNKVDFITANIESLNLHNKKKYGTAEPDIVGYEVRGMFIINTPTFYMFNSDYRIYTVDVFAEAIMKRLTDPELTLIVEDEMQTRAITIKYPYFRKPNYSLIDPLQTGKELSE